MDELVAVCREHGVRLISDEIYHGLTYERAAETALAHGDDAIVINSFSKYFSMTGWRVGWMVVPRGARAQSSSGWRRTSTSRRRRSRRRRRSGAFDAGEELEANRRVYAANRALLLDELPKAGFTTFAPADGAFYLYCDVSDMTGDAAALAKTLLDEAGVAVTPGTDFDARPRQPVPALLLRGNDGRHGRGGAASAGLGRASPLTLFLPAGTRGDGLPPAAPVLLAQQRRTR